MCLLTVAAVFLNAACGPGINKGQGDKSIVVQVETERKPPIKFVRPPVIHRGVLPGTKPQTEVEPKLSCSHQVGSIVRPGESIRLTYKSANAYADITLTLEDGRFQLKRSASNIDASAFGIANGIQYCWGKDNCFVATKNRDGSWTIKSLPFQ